MALSYSEKNNRAVIRGGNDNIYKYGYIEGVKQLDRFIPLDKIKFYDEYSRKIIIDGDEPILDHSRTTGQKPVEIIKGDPKRILDINSNPELLYNTEYMSFKPSCYWSQLKVYLSEIEFLTQVYKDAKDEEILLVYAGAAPATHIVHLHELFPKIKFILIDPSPFNREVFDLKYVKIHNGFFTPEAADYFSKVTNKYVAFLCDIRSYPASSATVVADMHMQFGWWRIMKPRLSMFKFRLPWKEDPPVDYGEMRFPEGDIHLLCYNGITSTEARIIVKQDAKEILYDSEKYESLMYSHNMVHRTNKYMTKEFGELKLADGPLYIDNCYDCSSLVCIARKYLKVVQNTSDIEKLKTFIVDIQRKADNPTNVMQKTMLIYKEQRMFKYLSLIENYVRVYQPIRNTPHEGDHYMEQKKVTGMYPELLNDFIIK